MSEKKKREREMSKILLPMFSYRIFIVLSLIFKSLLQFEFILVCGIRRWSGFFLFFVLHVSNFPNTIC